MVTVRKKLNKSAIILLAILAISGIVAIVCHFVGVINLAFLGDTAIMIADWASMSGWNVAIIGGVVFAAGMGVFWWLKDYIIGTEVPAGAVMGAGAYTPQEKISAPQETAVSA